MTYEQPLYEGVEYEMTLSFSHLYSNKWAAFRGTAKRFQLRRIIFPDFTPEEGKEYLVRFKVTKTGVFVYKGEEFRVCRAELAASATKMEVAIHKIFGNQPVGVVGMALQGAGVGTSANTTMAQKMIDAGFKKRC